MQPKNYDGFTPKRATNIDGFISRPGGDRPRRPVFRTAPANPQPKPVTLADMPKRPEEQIVRASAAAPAGTALVQPDYPAEGRRRRRHAPEDMPDDGGEHKKRSWKKIFKRGVLLFGALLLVSGLWFGFKFYKDISKITGNNNPLSLLGVFKPVALKSQDGRVNILVAANSADDVGHNGADLTDSIMVLSVDTRKNTALILSIPRDLWVNVPGAGHTKINAAYTNGGMSKLESVVEENLGLTINYNALVNYGAFRDLVNAVGGINITIKSDDPRGIYDPSLDYTSRRCCALAKYPNGPVTLNGKQALNLGRARGDAYGSYGYAQSDFTRTMYQREMLVAIKDKASQSSVVANPFKVSALVDAVGNNIKTNLQLNEIQTLYTYMKKIPDNKIDSYNVNTLKGKNTTMLQNYASPSGQSALIPAAGLDDFSDIQQQITKLLTADPLVKEAATVVVLNGTDTSGLASRQSGKLNTKGMDASAGDATANQATTTIVDNSNGEMPNSLAYLKTQYKATVAANAQLTARYPSADFILVLGQDAVPTTPTTSSSTSTTTSR